MKIHEFFVQRWEDEQPRFARVLRAVPTDRLDYRPHERSTNAAALAWQLAQEQKDLCDLLDTGEVHFEPKPAPATTDEIVAAWESATNELRSRLQKLDSATAERPAKFFVGKDEVWTTNIGDMLWGFLFDMVHHRGQLSTYIRPMGGKVPAIYGGSADDPGA